MNYKAPIAVIVICLAALAGLLFLASDSSKKERPINQVSVDDHVFGSSTSKIVLVEYSDYQCPACGVYHPYIKDITEKYKDKIAFVYRHFPLQQHLNAIPASKYSEAAAKQGKFWEMHDILFRKQAEWENLDDQAVDDMFISYAKELNLDLAKVKVDVNSEETMNKITTDWEGGRAAKVQWTPTFYLNGVKLEKEIPGVGINNPNPEEIEAIIKKELGL